MGSVGPRKLDISYPTTEFTKLVKMWEKYDESQMGIFVRNIKRYFKIRGCVGCVFFMQALRIVLLYRITSLMKVNDNQDN